MQEFGRYVILFIAAIAIIAIGYLFLQWAGIVVPSIIITVFWVVVAAVICIGGVLIILRMVQKGP